MTPYSYIRNIFSANAAKNGGVVRRRVDDVKRFASFQALADEVKRRGFHLLEAGDQYLIVCNSASCKLHF